LRQKDLRRVADDDEALRRHPEHTQLIDAAEAVLRRAQQSVIETCGVLEVQHGVDDVLERLRSGDGATLRHVPDEEHRDARFLREALETRSTFTHLPDAAGSALE